MPRSNYPHGGVGRAYISLTGMMDSRLRGFPLMREGQIRVCTSLWKCRISCYHNSESGRLIGESVPQSACSRVDKASRTVGPSNAYPPDLLLT